MPPIAIGIGSAVAGIAGGIAAKKGADAQAKAAENASQAAVAENRRQFDITQQNLQPFIRTGTLADQRLAYLLGLGSPSDYDGNGNYIGAKPAAAPSSTTYRPSPFMLRNGINDATSSRLAMLQDGGNLDGGRLMMDENGNLAPMSLVRSRASKTEAVTPSGTPAGGGFGSLLHDFSAEDFQTDPGYEFRLAEGQKALERSAAARGGLFSGATGKALVRYGQDFGSNEYENAYNRFNNNRTMRYNFLAGPAGLGQTTATQLGSIGADVAGRNASLLYNGATDAANARAAGTGALIGGITGGINNGLSWYQLSKQSQGG